MPTTLFWTLLSLHQTITMTIGYLIGHLDWGLWPKFLLMISGTFGIAWLLYELLIRGLRGLQPLFGVKPM